MSGRLLLLVPDRRGTSTEGANSGRSRPVVIGRQFDGARPYSAGSDRQPDGGNPRSPIRPRNQESNPRDRRSQNQHQIKGLRHGQRQSQSQGQGQGLRRTGFVGGCFALLVMLATSVTLAAPYGRTRPTRTAGGRPATTQASTGDTRRDRTRQRTPGVGPGSSRTTKPETTAVEPPAQGYWVVSADGAVSAFGTAGFFGPAIPEAWAAPIAAAAATPHGHGYWLVATDGTVTTFGDAHNYGHPSPTTINRFHTHVVAILPTAGGHGYRIVTAAGSTYDYGNATRLTPTSPDMRTSGRADTGTSVSTPGNSTSRRAPIAAAAATPHGHGYWLVATDGMVTTFGDAHNYGHPSPTTINRFHTHVVAILPTAGGHGYRIVTAAGSTYDYGNATRLTPTSPVSTTIPITAAATTPHGHGYWLVGADGTVTAFGDAHSYTTNPTATGPVVAMAAVTMATHSATLAVSGGSLDSARLHQNYVGLLTDTEPSTQAKWTVIGGALPPGLVLAPNGWILGSPDGTGLFTFTVQVTAARSAPSTATHAAGGGAGGAVLAVATATATLSIDVSPPVAPAASPEPATAGSSGISPEASTETTSIPDAGPDSDVPTTAPIMTPQASAVAIADQDHWSGYEIGGGPYSEATGTFTVPTLLATDTPAQGFVSWVGIDGTNGGPLIQAGVQDIPDPADPGTFVIDAWWEILPAPLTRVPSLVISPGDPVTVTITRLNTTDWQIQLRDDATGQQFETDQQYSGPGSSAEWIVEAPVNYGVQTPLAPFTPSVVFTDLEVAGAQGAITEEVMEQNGSVVATPSALTTAGFAVTSAGSVPQTP